MIDFLIGVLLICQGVDDFSGCDVNVSRKLQEVVADSVSVNDYEKVNELLEIKQAKVEFKPSKSSPQESVVLMDKSGWRISRSMPINNFSVEYLNDNGKFTKLKISERLKKDIYLMDAGLNSEGDLIIVGYDVHLNASSGRRVSGITNGIDVFLVNKEDRSVSNIGKRIPLAGLDDKIYTRYGEDQLILCARNTCFDVSYDGGHEQWKKIDPGMEFVELEFLSDSVVAGIFRKSLDDRFDEDEMECDQFFGVSFVKGVLKKNSVELAGFLPGEIPYGLIYSEGAVKYRLADDADSFRNLLEFDFYRMNNNGLIDVGVNNLEGRIAWSQAYYLNGLMALIDREPLKPLKFHGVAERVSKELSGIVRACESDYPYLYARRYSLDREPILYALHLGRVSSIVHRGTQLGLVNGERCLQKIKQDMVALDATIEKPVYDSSARLVDLKYGVGFPFWADGSNVPYNFISGYLNGFLPFGDYFGREVLISKILNGPFKSKPYPKIWNYWGGVGNEGWKKGDVSVNTPKYPGNQDMKAHISYRTKDASAIINCYHLSYCRLPIDDDLMAHFEGLTERGALMPFINDTWASFGDFVQYDNEVLAIRRLARSASHHNFYSQVFVLASMLNESGGSKH